VPKIRFNAVIFACIAFFAAAAAGMGSKGTSGQQAFFFCVSVVLNLCAPPA
jgi:hypothetical protein